MRLYTLLQIFFFNFLLIPIFVQATLVDQTQHWQTFETKNFRVHYTPEYKQWALSSAREMENIRALIKRQQGRILTEKVDAYIIDPFNAANGFAMPLSQKPYMALFATPPQSDSVIANTDSWQQLLILHEYVHLVHLAQKSRSPLRNKIANWFDLYDLSQINTDRWVAEGYATLLESKLSGRGRLYNNSVEAIIKQFAREGALPTYHQLSSANDKFLSSSMAYLVGVRYLKWLEENYGEETLDAVWTRWKAVKERSFEQAFKGVFQDSAGHLYQRFIAEYTYQAMKEEATFSKNKSSLWLNLTGNVTAPTLSPNEQLLAVIERNTKGDGKVNLNVYSTTDNTDAKEKFNENIKTLLAEDPLDIANKIPTIFKRKKLYSLDQRNKRGIRNPRWLDNDTIIFGASSLDSINNFHQDLFKWQIKSNTVTQLTHSKNLRRFDISPDGKSIIAEHSQYGYSQLVSLSISGKMQTELTSKTLSNVYDFPRFKPKKNSKETTQFAYLQSSLNEKWQLKVRDLSSNINEQIIPLPESYQYLSFPEWSKNGAYLFYVAGKQGQLKLYRFDFTNHKLDALTSGQHPVSWPISRNNKQLLHLSINSQGPDIYQLSLNDTNIVEIAKTTTSATMPSRLASVFKVDKASNTINESLGNSKPYGIGIQEGTFTIGESYYSASSSLFEVGYKSGDVLSRLDWQINASKDVFKNILSGTSANIRWQGWPIKLLAHGYQFTLKTKRQYGDALSLGTMKEQGLFIEAQYPYQNETFKFNTIAQVKYAETNNLTDKYSLLGFTQYWSYEQQSWGIKQSVAMSYLSGNKDIATPLLNHTINNDFNGNDGEVSIVGHFKNYRLGIHYQWKNRSSGNKSILNLGGYGSTLILPKAHANKQLAPELAFYRKNGNHYQKIELFTPFSFGDFFYNRHQFNNLDYIDSYGFKGEVLIDFGFTGVSNLSINYGLVQVKPEQGSTENQGWLGLWHKW